MNRPKQSNANLFVKNLDASVDDGRLRYIFGPFGEIISAKIMREVDGRSKGFGFVSYSLPSEADRAIFGMNGRIVAGKPIYVNFAQSKAERSKLLQAQFNKANEEVPEVPPARKPDFLLQRIAKQLSH